MIEPDLLRQLGWSETLITEITRVGNDITQGQPTLPHIDDPGTGVGAFSSNSVFYNAEHLNTTNRLLVEKE